jgi:hypothetical protein
MATQHTIEVPTSYGPRIVAVTPDMFGQWTGRRFRDGEEWHAPVLHRDHSPYTGARACDCDVCQAFVDPTCKPHSMAVRGPRRTP